MKITLKNKGTERTVTLKANEFGSYNDRNTLLKPGAEAIMVAALATFDGSATTDANGAMVVTSKVIDSSGNVLGIGFGAAGKFDGMSPLEVNTSYKMAHKRAKIDAVITAFNLSSELTQDLEEIAREEKYNNSNQEVPEESIAVEYAQSVEPRKGEQLSALDELNLMPVDMAPVEEKVEPIIQLKTAENLEQQGNFPSIKEVTTTTTNLQIDNKDYMTNHEFLIYVASLPNYAELVNTHHVVVVNQLPKDVLDNLWKSYLEGLNG